MMTTLWGKHQKSGITLLQHTEDVVTAGDALFGSLEQPTRLGRCWLRFFKIEQDQWPSFYWNLLAAELLHDWGKANDGMQAILTGTGKQSKIRHEHFSALLIGLPSVTQWLKGNEYLNVPLILSAVLTHHLKAGSNSDGWASEDTGKRLRLLERDGQFAELVQVAQKRLGLDSLDLTKIPTQWVVGKPEDIRQHRTYIQDKLLGPLNRNSKFPNRLLLALRSALIAADSAGSGYARTGKSIEATIWREFADRDAWDGNKIYEEIIEKRIVDLNDQFKKRGDRPFQWDKFQCACDDLPNRTLLLAPCGSGKTLAAWRWIAAQADRHPVGRVLFLYPTRATAKEGFRDYVSWAPEADAILMHGTAAFDLHGMFDNESNDPRKGLRYEADRRLYSLGYWTRRVFSATVDQFLGFLQYGYGPICMLPVLADSVIVIDEVHSFDRHMFTALKEFLLNFDVPVLCMTATLPRDRQNQLADCGLTISNDQPEDLKKIADAPRYTVQDVGTREQAFRAVHDALNADKRVLWVVNTVRRCHEITTRFALNYDKLITEDGKPVYCYHSRYLLNDRVERHNDIIEALKVGQPAALGITTQVCEMSLDLDVDLLVTEKCPVTSLIQRMGRCNRSRIPRSLSQSGTVLVYAPDSDMPYSENDLRGWDAFLSKTMNRELSQSALEHTLSNLPDDELPQWLGDNIVMFLQSGPYAMSPHQDDEESNTFREGNDFNRPCVLLNQVDDFLKAEEKMKPGFIVPIPKHLARARDDEKFASHRQLPNYLGVADDGHYHKLVGYTDRLLAEWGND